MVATVGRISGGSGYEYLTNSVASGAHDYYAGTGERAGRWHGDGAAFLGLHGDVTKAQMKAVYGQFLDPRSLAFGSDGESFEVAAGARELAVLGAKPYRFASADGGGSSRQAVAGFDLQFAPSKSVSALWALAPAEVRARIEELHDRSIDEAFAYLEQHALFARAGKNGVRQLDADGFVVARFQHRTNRNGDPQLHTHCAVLNRVFCPEDGKWRTLDGRALFRELHAAGAVYARQFEESLSAELGVSWQATVTPDGELAVVPFREVDGVPQRLVEVWSSRRSEIDAHWQGLVAGFRDAHGCEPTTADRARLLQQATLATRRPKGGGGGLHDRWEDEAGHEADVVRGLLDRTAATAPELLDEGEVVRSIVTAVGTDRARFHRSHVAAKASAWLSVLPTSTDGVVARVEALTDRVMADRELVPVSGLRLGVEPPEGVLHRQSGESQFTQHGARRWSTIGVLRAESEIVGWASTETSHRLDPVHVASTIEQLELATGRTLGHDQVAAVQALTTGRHQLVTVIGPAGAGKTTMLRGVVDAYRTAGHKAIGLALSQNATNVLHDETGAVAVNIAAWKLSRDQPSLALHAGDLLVVDEAAMVPTKDLADICRHAWQAGARVAFVGDPMQLTSPEAGGIITDLIGSESSVQLTDVRRFRNAWEGPASLQLRDGNTRVAALYASHDRIIGVTDDSAGARIVADWYADRQAGKESVIVTDTNAEAGELAALAQAVLRDAGDVGAGVVELKDRNLAGVGDIIQARLNASDLIASDGRRVANRDTWRVLSAGPDGVIGQRINGGAATVIFPIRYLANHAQLAYAGTIHAVQGRTVDVCRSLVKPTTGSSALYVAMTRGRDANVAYCQTDGYEHDEFGTGRIEPCDAFEKAMLRDDREHSARSTLRDALNTEASIGVLQVQLAETAHLAASEAWFSWAPHHLDDGQWAHIDADPQRSRIIDALSSLVGRADLGRALSTATNEVRSSGAGLARRLAGAIYDYRDAQGTSAQPTVLDPDPAWQPPAQLDALTTHVVELQAAIDDRTRMLTADAVVGAPAWWPTELAHDRTLAGDIAVYRDTWGITDMTTAIGTQPPEHAHRQNAQWAELQERVAAITHDRNHNGRDDHLDQFDRDGNSIDDQVDANLADRMAALHDKARTGTSHAVPTSAPVTSGLDWRHHFHSDEHGAGYER